MHFYWLTRNFVLATRRGQTDTLSPAMESGILKVKSNNENAGFPCKFT